MFLQIKILSLTKSIRLFGKHFAATLLHCQIGAMQDTLPLFFLLQDLPTVLQLADFHVVFLPGYI